MDESGIDKIISSVLQKLSQEGKVVYEKDWGNAFGTKRMYEALPSLDAPVSVWKTYDIYSYWFRYENEKFYLIFPLTLSTLSLRDFLGLITADFEGLRPPPL